MKFQNKTMQGLMAALVLLPFFVVLVFLITGGGDEPAVPPRPANMVLPDDRATYDEYLSPPKTPDAPARAFIESLKHAVSTSTSLRYDLAPLPPRPTVETWQTHYTIENLGNWDDAPSTPTVELLAVGVASTYDIRPPLGSASAQDAYTFYDSRGAPIPDEQIEQWGFEEIRTLLNPGEMAIYPVFRLNGLDHPRPGRVMLYDADTLHLLGYGARSRPQWRIRDLGDNVFSSRHDGVLLHPAPLRLVIDVAHGPVETVDLPLEMGATADFDEAIVRIVSDLVAKPPRDARVRPESFGFIFPETSEQTRQQVVVAATPQSSEKRITYQFVNAAGEALEEEYHGGSFFPEWNFALMLHLNPAEEEAKYLRVRHYADIKRFIVDLGPMPGTPSVNDNVKDLMEVQIPYVHQSNPREVAHMLESLVQLQRVDIGFSDPLRGLSASERRSLTPREAILFMTERTLESRELEIDMENGSIRIKSSPSMIEKTLQKLNRMF